MGVEDLTISSFVNQVSWYLKYCRPDELDGTWSLLKAGLVCSMVPSRTVLCVSHDLCSALTLVDTHLYSSLLNHTLWYRDRRGELDDIRLLLMATDLPDGFIRRCPSCEW